jgi:L-fuculose-phosphate aldolase
MQPEMFKKIKIWRTINSGVGSGSFNYNWEVIEQTDLSGNLEPSGEMPLHFGLQKELGQHKDDVRVVVHVHPTYCIAAMHAGIELGTISNSFPELNRYTKVAHNVGDVAPISEELGEACHHNLGLDREGNIKFDIVGIKGHGVVAIGNTPWRAYEHIERLEHICKIVLASGKY